MTPKTVNMEDLCSTCLSVGRNLFFIGDTGYCNMFYQILNEIEVYDRSVCVRVCWECCALLRRFHRFKSQAQRSYTQLMQYTQLQNGLAKFPLHKEPNLKIQEIVNINYPDIVVKEESEDDVPIDKLKRETTDDMHYEPETFVRDLNVTQTERESSKRHEWGEPIGPVVEDSVKSIGAMEGVGAVKGVGAARGEGPAEGGRRAPRNTERLPERPQCVECGKMFSSKKTYRYHLNVLHRGENRYPCPRCGKVYQWKSNLGRHMRSHKARDSGELHCSPCGKLFASVATYRQHLAVSRRHVPENEFSFTCDECGKKFVSKTRLRDHIDWEHLHNIKFRCHLCNKAYKCHTSLYVHLQNVHRDKDARHNLCHVCGKSYQNAAKLKYHIVAMHTSETPYRCERCGAAFGWYSSLYRHVREVHYKMKVQPKKSKRGKKNEMPHILPPQVMPT